MFRRAEVTSGAPARIVKRMVRISPAMISAMRVSVRGIQRTGIVTALGWIHETRFNPPHALRRELWDRAAQVGYGSCLVGRAEDGSLLGCSIC